jgi:L-asparaginase
MFVLGGTISGSADPHGRSVPSLTAEELVARVPEIGDLAEIEFGLAMRVGSHELTPATVCELAHEIVARVAGGCDAVVVTQGTDTLEETAYALALQLDVGVPVVLTAAMRPPIAAGSDGPANLVAAFQVATTSTVAALGPVVVMHDEIHHPCWVTKAHTSRVAAFASPGRGPIGVLAEGSVKLDSRPVASDLLGLPKRVEQRVDIVWTWIGADGQLVDAAASDAAGLVVGAMGGGHVPPAMVSALRRAVESGKPVVLASRCAEGPILTRTYAGPGTETELLGMGLIPAGCLSAVKSRLRLLVALELGIPPTEVFPVAER